MTEPEEDFEEAPPPSVEMLMERGFERWRAEQIMTSIETGDWKGCCRELTEDEALALFEDHNEDDYEPADGVKQGA